MQEKYILNINKVFEDSVNDFLKNKSKISATDLQGIAQQAEQILKNIENHISCIYCFRINNKVCKSKRSINSDFFNLSDSRTLRPQSTLVKRQSQDVRYQTTKQADYLENKETELSKNISKAVANQLQQQNVKRDDEPIKEKFTYAKTYQQLLKSQKRPISTTPNERKITTFQARAHSPLVYSRKPTMTNTLKPKEDLTQIQEKARDRYVMLNLFDSEVTMNNFRLDQILGRGSYATVRLSTCKQSKDKFAIKIYEKSKLQDSQRMQNVQREIQILKSLDHPNIIKLVYALEDKRSINLVMEYMSSQSLANYIKTKVNRQLSNNDALHIFHQITRAVLYLHENGIAHRDIKMENILLNPINFVKLIDFGFSIRIPEGKKLNIFCGTPSYMSPEIVSKTPHQPFSSDVWSLGILLSTLVTGQHPFKGQSDRELYRSIQCTKWRSPEGIKVNDDTSRVIRGCLEKQINKRWTIQQILQDPIFVH